MALLRPALALLLLSAALAAAAGPARAEREAVVYRVQHRTAEELLPLAQTVLGGEGSASLDRSTNSLVLLGPHAIVQATTELLRQQDRRLRSVVLRYESQRLDELQARGIRIDWGARTGDLRVGNVRFPREGVRVQGFALHTEREGGLSGMVRVLEGQTGRIGSGAVVPIRTGGRWYRETTLIEAESGFEARPRILGDGRVQVQLFPAEATVTRGGRVHYTAGATTVTVRPGDTVALGGIARTTDTHHRGSRVLDASQKARSERVFLLTVELDDE